MLIELENLFENEGERLLIDQSFDFSGEELNGVRPFVSPVKVKGEVRNRAGIVSLHARAAVPHAGDDSYGPRHRG